MHLLLIAQYFYPDVGGASTRAYNTALALKSQGCEVTVVTAFPHYPHGRIPAQYKRRLLTKEELNGLKVFRTWIPSMSHSTVRNRIMLHLSFIFSSLFAMGRVRKFDLILAMNPNLFAFYSAIVYRLIFRRKIIRNVDDLWPEVFYDLGIVKSKLAKKVLDAISKLSYRHSSHIIPVSSGYVKTLVGKYDIPNDKITVIEHGVDVNKFKIKTRSDSVSHDKKIVMYSGTLTEGYDFETVLQAAKILSKEPIRFIIRGTGPMFDPIVKMVEEDKLLNVEVSNTVLSMDGLVTLMNSADIFLLPMNSTGANDEGLPTKILEYQAIGKPIICISEGEPGRYILRCQCGLVTKLKQPSELAKAIKNLATDQILRKKLGDNGYDHIIKNMTFEDIGKRLLDVISKTLCN